jgi:peptidoglycan/xylan/chitin deacetylase (PgdA/CDA1 family)
MTARSRVLPVLTYHSIDTSGSPVSISPAEFRRHIETLHAAGWRPLTVGAALEGLAAGLWPAKSLLLTFDDGYASVMEHAAPVIRDCGFTATVFVVTAMAGMRNRWAGQPPWVPDAALLGWSDLRALVDAGWELGAHSRTHARLPELGPAEAEREIAGSKAELEDRCGARVETFAYPYGARTPEIEALAARTYQAAFGTRLACVSPRSRPMNLDRIDAYYLRGLALIARLDSLAARLYLSGRRAARALRPPG